MPFIEGPIWTRVLAYIMASIIIILNSWQIAIMTKKRRKTSFEKLLLSMCSNELAFGVLAIIFAIAFQIKMLTKQELIIYTLWYVMMNHVCLAELSHLVTITLDRVWAITSPIKHRNYVTGKKMVIAITLCWFLPILVVSVYIGVYFVKNKSPHDRKIIGQFVRLQLYRYLAVVIIAMDLIFVLSYSSIIHKTRRDRTQLGNNKKQNKCPHRKTLFLCISYAALFVISTLPFVVVFLIPRKVPEWLINGSMGSYLLNSIANSTIYLGQYYSKKRGTNQSPESS